MRERVTVACVLKSGGDFGIQDARNLYGSVIRHFGDVDFRCLVDAEAEAFTNAPNWTFQELETDWPSWWAKMELFRLPGPVITLDLDTVPVGDCRDICTFVQSLGPREFMCLRDFGRVPYGSGIMGWGHTNMTWLADLFARDYPQARHRVSKSGYHLYLNNKRYHGDQAYMTEKAPSRMQMVLIQDKFDGIDSYKWTVAKSGLKENQRIVCFHGKPRPLEVRPQPDWLSREGWTRERSL